MGSPSTENWAKNCAPFPTGCRSNVSVFWEHKECMCLRLRFMEENGFLPAPGPADAYEEVRRIFQQIFQLAVKYQVQPDVRIPQKILEYIDRGADREEQILTAVLTAPWPDRLTVQAVSGPPKMQMERPNVACNSGRSDYNKDGIFCPALLGLRRIAKGRPHSF